LARYTPLQEGDKLTFRGEVPQGYQAAAFYLDSAGGLHELVPELSGAEKVDRAEFPARSAWRVREGPAGTVLVLLCAGRDGKPRLNGLREALLACGHKDGTALPELPPQTVLLFREGAVDLAVPPGEVMRDPQQTSFTRVRDFLNLLRGQLKQRYDYFTGAAMPQD
jgi:hypothetical protein